MAQTICNGDATTIVVPQAFTDLSGSVAGTQMPGGTPTGTGVVVMTNGPTLIAPVLGTPASGTLTNCTFPTLNQNTSGSSASCTGNAATATTAAACSGNSATATVASGLTGTPAITVGAVTCTTITGTGVHQAKRFNAHAGTALASTDFAASTGWGTSPTITVNRGTDQGASVQITAKATVAANPTLTLTFHDGTWTNAPIIVCDRTDVTAATGAPSASVSNQWAVTSVTATTAIFTFNGTPVANSSYGLSFIAMGV